MPWGPDVLDFVVGGVFGDDHRTGAPDTCYFALLASEDPEFTVGVELTGTGYARVGITNDDDLWTITDGDFTNDVEIRWPVSLDEWGGEINQCGIYDASTAGTIWWFGEITPALDVFDPGRQLLIPAGNLDITQLPY